MRVQRGRSGCINGCYAKMIHSEGVVFSTFLHPPFRNVPCSWPPASLPVLPSVLGLLPYSLFYSLCLVSCLTPCPTLCAWPLALLPVLLSVLGILPYSLSYPLYLASCLTSFSSLCAYPPASTVDIADQWRLLLAVTSLSRCF